MWQPNRAMKLFSTRSQEHAGAESFSLFSVISVTSFRKYLDRYHQVHLLSSFRY